MSLTFNIASFFLMEANNTGETTDQTVVFSCDLRGITFVMLAVHLHVLPRCYSQQVKFLTYFEYTVL